MKDKATVNVPLEKQKKKKNNFETAETYQPQPLFKHFHSS